ncbi:MAG: CoA transferase [Pseudomonadota bacterium]
MLNGIRIVELASYVAGPGACALLADWGAEVIKVEAKQGDPWRHFFASVGREDTENRVFETDNRGKRSIALDISDPTDAATLRALILSADVFVSNTRPASLARAGLGWETLRALKPNLIFANFTGFGTSGPEADKPGFDITAFWARSGLCSLMTVKGSEPAQLRTGIGDHMAALGLAGAVCAALLHRERTGEGQKVETSLLRMGVYAGASEHAIQLQVGRLASTRPRVEAPNPINNFFRTSDERWFVMVPRTGSADWVKLANALGHPEWLEDERFQGVRARRTNGVALVTLLDAAFTSLSWDAMAELLDTAGIIWGPVQTVGQVSKDPQAFAAGCFVEVSDADGVRLLPAGPIDFGAMPSPKYRPAPKLDEHGDDLRSEYAPA